MMALPTSKVYLDSAGVLREGELDQQSIDAQLAGKLDVSALANYLAGKVDTTALQAALDAKASASDLAAIANKVNNPIIKYVASGAVMTLADLMATYPASSSLVDQFAIVSDLYGSVRETVRCRFDGTNYRWVPQREAYSGTTAVTTGTVNILPLITPPTLRATGTLTGNVSFTPSVVNAYVGMRQRIVVNGALGVFVPTITGLLGSNITLLGGNSRTIEYGPTGWFSAD
jgi:hypothetical protein